MTAATNLMVMGGRDLLYLWIALAQTVENAIYAEKIVCWALEWENPKVQQLPSVMTKWCKKQVPFSTSLENTLDCVVCCVTVVFLT